MRILNLPLLKRLRRHYHFWLDWSYWGCAKRRSWSWWISSSPGRSSRWPRALTRWTGCWSPSTSSASSASAVCPGLCRPEKKCNLCVFFCAAGWPYELVARWLQQPTTKLRIIKPCRCYLFSIPHYKLTLRDDYNHTTGHQADVCGLTDTSNRARII